MASLSNLFSGGDLLLILFLVLILFGAKKLPELARGMGQAIREFQKAKDEFSDELHKAGQSDTKTTPSAQSLPQNPAAPASGQTQPDPDRAVTPGDQTKPA